MTAKIALTEPQQYYVGRAKEALEILATEGGIGKLADQVNGEPYDGVSETAFVLGIVIARLDNLLVVISQLSGTGNGE
jgi:hypothetical protein